MFFGWVLNSSIQSMVIVQQAFYDHGKIEFELGIYQNMGLRLIADFKVIKVNEFRLSSLNKSGSICYIQW